MNVVFLGIALALAAGAGYWIVGRGKPRPAGTWEMGAVLASFSLAFASYAPLLGDAEESVVPHVDRLISNSFSLCAATSVLAVIIRLNEPDDARAHRRLRTRVAVLAVSVALLAILFVCEALTHRSPQVYGLYLLVFLGSLVFTIVDLFRQALKHAKEAKRASVRVGLRVAAVGCGFAVIYALYKTTVLVALGTGHHLVSEGHRCSSLVTAPCVFSVTAPALAVVLIAVGLTLPAALYPLQQIRHHRWEVRAHDQLRPLWQVLTDAIPDIVLTHDNDDADFRLQRRVVEISDGILTLQPYRSQSVQAAAARQSAAALPQAAPVDREAFAEAIELKAALAAYLVQAPASAPALPPAGSNARPGDLKAEAQWLLRVVSAYTHLAPSCRRPRPGSTCRSLTFMDLTNPEFLRDPYPTLARLRSACPVQPLTDRKGRTSYLVLGYDEARQALADPRLSKDTEAFFSGRSSGRNLHPALSRTMLATDPPDHTRLRRLATPAFTTGAVARLRPAISRITDELLDAWPAAGDVDAVATLTVPLPVAVISELLGVPDDDRAQVRAWSVDLFAAGAPERTDVASHALADYLGELIDAKRTAPGDSLLDTLIATRDEGDRLSESELASLAALLLVAGHETTTAFIGNALLALLDHPMELGRLRAQPDLLPQVLDELLRFDAPVSQATFRYTTTEVELGGQRLPAGSPVLVSPGAANRDPARFPDADRLDLDRDAAGHLAFGHGIHRCLGAPLARAEAEIALGQVITRFPDLQLAVRRDQLVWQPTRLVRGLSALPLSLGRS